MSFTGSRIKVSSHKGAQARLKDGGSEGTQGGGTGSIDPSAPDPSSAVAAV
jgi:hypothetical protein